MNKQNTSTDDAPICNFVPGYAFYEGIGNRLSEFLVDFFEAIADLAGRFRA
jgi:hypothetical protein